jgi:DNA polymerase-3 subunit epsilon
VQRSFDDLGTPLVDTTFCVVDLETTGATAASCGITEIGALKLRAGECLGTFQTLVNPGAAIPPEVTMLTGITESMVAPAPRIESVLPAFVEFAEGCVLVGHNIRFDVSFLNAALERDQWPPLRHPIVDTCALARRLLRDDVPNCRLGTLASRLRLDHRPTHRALDDALATADLLHVLLERAAAFGVLGLDDLLALPRLGGHPQVAKLRLTTALPRGPGVYLFVDAQGEVLYVGKATNLRQRVRSYFSGDERRKIGNLLRETHDIRHVPCASTLEAAVTEVRLIHHHQPRYNRVGRRWRSYTYVKLTLDEPFPRLAVVREPRPDAGIYLGPLPSASVARLVVDAVHSVVPLRRCATRLGSTLFPRRDTKCVPAQLGVALCPCSSREDQAAYPGAARRAALGLTTHPRLLLDPLVERMHALAATDRFEEAADVRDRGAALAHALGRQHRLDRLRRAGVVRVVVGASGARAEVRNGILVRTWSGDSGLPLELGPDPPGGGPLPRALADEVGCIASWLEAEAGRVTLEHCDGGLASDLDTLPSFRPGAGRLGASRR